MTLEEKKKFRDSLKRPERAPAPGEVRIYEDVTFTEEKMIPTREGETHVYLVRPKDEKACRGLYVNMHGGGFIGPHREDDTLYCRRVAAETGCLVVDIDYKLAPEYPYPYAFHECYDVVLYMIERAEEYRFDPEKLILGGNSAGGNFTTGITQEGIRQGTFRPILEIMLYPALDINTDPQEKQKDEPDPVISVERARLYNQMYADEPGQTKEPQCSPIFGEEEILRELPDTVIYTAEKDSLRKEGEAYGLHLAELGVNVTIKRWQGCPHGFFFNYTPETFACYDRVIEAMKNSLRRAELFGS